MIYKRILIDLSIARDNVLFDLGGEFRSFMIVKEDAPFEFKINSETADVLYSSEVKGFEREGVYRKFFISNTVNAGKQAALIVFG